MKVSKLSVRVRNFIAVFPETIRLSSPNSRLLAQSNNDPSSYFDHHPREVSPPNMVDRFHPADKDPPPLGHSRERSTSAPDVCLNVVTPSDISDELLHRLGKANYTPLYGKENLKFRYLFLLKTRSIFSHNNIVTLLSLCCMIFMFVFYILRMVTPPC